VLLAQLLTAQRAGRAVRRLERLDPPFELVHLEFQRLILDLHRGLTFARLVAFGFQVRAFGILGFGILQGCLRLFNRSFNSPITDD
jgi:hypothetical protein